MAEMDKQIPEEKKIGSKVDKAQQQKKSASIKIDSKQSGKKAAVRHPIPTKKKIVPKKSEILPKKEIKKVRTKHSGPAKLYLHDQFYQELSFFQKMNARKSLGLDIDSDKVRYVLVKKSKEEVQILEWGVQKFPSEEKDRRKALQIALENIKAKVYKRGMEVLVSIFSPEISSRQVIFPEMKKTADLKQAIFHKNESDLQNFSEKSIWTYEILEDFEDEGLTKLRIAIIVAPDEVVNEYVLVFNKVGIEITRLIPRPSAIQASYKKMIFRPGRDLLIDIGYDLTQMCFIKNGQVEFVRNVSIGSRNLEVTIHSKPEDGKKQAPGTKSTTEDLSAQKPDEVRGRLLSRIKDLKSKQNPVLHTFFSEILRSLAFFQGKDVRQYIERIFVTGYGIRKESLLPYLKSRLNIPLFILTPQFEERPTRTTEFGEYFSTLGTTIQDSDSANILPQSYKNRIIFKKLNMGIGVLSAILIIVLGIISSGQYNLINQKKAMIVDYQKEYDLLNPVESKYQEILQLISDVNLKNKELKSYIQIRPPVIEILRLFSNEVPRNILLDRIDFIKLNVNVAKEKFKNDYNFQLDIDGIITSDPLMADVTLINFVNQMIELKYFKHIELLNKYKDPDLKITRFGLRLFL